MSTLSFVERIELEFSGNHFSRALCLEDVDNDGVSILIYSCEPRTMLSFYLLVNWKCYLTLFNFYSSMNWLLVTW